MAWKVLSGDKFDYLSDFILLEANRAAVTPDYCEHLLFQPDQEDKAMWK